MGVKLFVRKSRGVEPTDQCQALLKHIVTMHAALTSFDREAMEFASGIKGFAKIAVTRDTHLAELPGEIAAFSRRHRDVRVSLSEASNADVMESVCGGDADVGLFIDAGHSSGLMTWPYARGRWVALLPDRHPLAGLTQVMLEDLQPFDLIGSCDRGPLKALLERAALQRGLTLRPRIDAGGMDATAALVQAGEGIALATDFTARRWATQHRVRIVPLAEEWAAYEVVVGVARQDALPVIPRRLVDALRMAESEVHLQAA